MKGVLIRSLSLMLMLAISPQCRKADAVVEDPAERQAQEMLAGYLRIDTSNPPGNETAAARFLQGLLQKAGIEALLVGSNPARQSVYARLRSGRPDPALLLVHHLDVVPANASEWSVAPFSGSASGGYIWGRGALDIKSLGIAQLLALAELKKPEVSLRRDVIFLGVADEEGGGTHGCRELLEQHPELFENVGFVLNEGGANETIVDKISFWGIEVGQKIPLWVKVTVATRGGHAAVPPDDGGSVKVLRSVLDSVEKIDRPYRVVPSVERHFKALAAAKKGIKREIMLDPQRYFSSESFEKEFPASYRSLLRDTMAVTEIQGGSGVNSVPSRATASIDMRLLPDQSADVMLGQIVKAAGERAKVEVLLKGEQGGESTIDTDLYRLLARSMIRAEPGSVVGPIISPGTTDSRFFRARGMTAYGVSPFKVNYYDAEGVHGIDERIRSRFFHEGVRLTKSVVRDFCVAK